jgi:hypothetical protein
VSRSGLDGIVWNTFLAIDTDSIKEKWNYEVPKLSFYLFLLSVSIIRRVLWPIEVFLQDLPDPS